MANRNPDSKKSNQEGVRINKYLSQLGICSRREADTFVGKGLVSINGKLAENGSRVLPGDDVRLEGKRIGDEKPRHVYIVLNKPVGVVSTTDARDPDNIIDFMDYPERIFPIGRLDKDSDGLIILTNDGDIVNYMLRARYQHEKEYEVTVDKKITEAFMEGMSQSVPILDTMTEAAKVKQVDDYRFRIVLTQGLNRQIRRMCEYFSYDVVRLTRWRIMNVTLGSLRPGEWRYITAKEMAQLRELLKKRVKAVDDPIDQDYALEVLDGE